MLSDAIDAVVPRRSPPSTSPSRRTSTSRRFSVQMLLFKIGPRKDYPQTNIASRTASSRPPPVVSRCASTRNNKRCNGSRTCTDRGVLWHRCDSTYITHRYGKDQLKIKSLSESDFMKHLELAIQFGAPFLFENVDEELDPMLDPVLVSVLCRGAFTWSMGLASNTRCRGWFLGRV